MIFPHVAAGKWNDYAKMNSFLSRAIFPSMSYEYMNDFADRTDTARAYLFERVLFADRAAAFRGVEFQKTWRTASEAVALQGSRYWWAPIRKNLIEFVGEVDMTLDSAGVGIGTEVEPNPETEVDVLALEEEEGTEDEYRSKEIAAEQQLKQLHSGKPVLTYISRQDWGRRMLKAADHEVLVNELNELEKKYGWEVGVSLERIGIRPNDVY